jgi:hypothetical protein
MKTYRGREGTALSLLTSAPDGEWPTSLPGCFTTGKESRSATNRRLGGPQGVSESLEEVEKKLFFLLELENRTVKRVVTWTQK